MGLGIDWSLGDVDLGLTNFGLYEEEEYIELIKEFPCDVGWVSIIGAGMALLVDLLK